jgi:hypothetical protein
MASAACKRMQSQVLNIVRLFQQSIFPGKLCEFVALLIGLPYSDSAYYLSLPPVALLQ